MNFFTNWLRVPFIIVMCFVPMMCAACNGCGKDPNVQSLRDMTGRYGNLHTVQQGIPTSFEECRILDHDPSRMAWYFECGDGKKFKEHYIQGEAHFEPADRVSRQSRRASMGTRNKGLAPTYQTWPHNRDG